MRNRIKKGIVIFFLATVIAYGIIIFFFLRDVPRNITLSPNVFLITGLLITFAATHYFNILRVHQLAKIFTDTFAFSDSLLFTMGGIFLGLITPFQSGGIPLQIYLLSKHNVSPGESTSLLFIRGVQSFIVFVITVPFTIVFFSGLFTGQLVAGLLRYFLVFYLTVIIVIILLLLFPVYLKSLVERRLKEGKLRSVLLTVIGEAANFRSGLSRFFTTGKKHMLLSTLWTLISLYASFSMAYFIVLMMGGKNNFFLAFHIQMLLTFLLAFVPTPGSSGFAEGGGAVFYSLLIPKTSIIAYVFIWRTIVSYIPAFLGMISMIAKFKTIYNLPGENSKGLNADIDIKDSEDSRVDADEELTCENNDR